VGGEYRRMSSPPPREPIPTLSELPLVISTQRLRIRPTAESDADALFRYCSDPEVTPFVSWAAHTDVEQTRQWLRDGAEALAKGTDVVWAIEQGGEAIGAIGLHGIRWQVRAWRWDRAELGYWLGKPHWNQGLASEAAHAVTRWAFETLGLHKVTIGCIEGNIGSQKVIERVGYRFVGRCEDDAWRGDRWWHHLRYELTTAEWADSTRTLRFKRPQ
jgi:RimJ/RimL family protein N-acetyltransferase